MKPLSMTTDVAVVAVLGFSIWEVHKAYTGAVPSMGELRECVPGSARARAYSQHLLDADITVGGVALFAAIAASILTRSILPVLLISGTYGILAYYHHSVLLAPQP